MFGTTSPFFERLQLVGTTSTFCHDFNFFESTSTFFTRLQLFARLLVFGTTSNNWQGSNVVCFSLHGEETAEKVRAHCSHGPVKSNLRSYPPSLYLDSGKEGMIHLLIGTYVQKQDSVFSLIG